MPGCGPAALLSFHINPKASMPDISSTMRLRLLLAYDGSRYCGWQIQPNGITIEEKLNKALNRLTGEDIRVIGASRTDSGVHALGNVAVFDTESPIPPERLIKSSEIPNFSLISTANSKS